MGGATTAFSSTVRRSFYTSLGLAGLGARATLGPVEVAPRVVFVGADGSAIYNDAELPQSLIGGGASAQVGAPIRLGALRLSQGVEAGWLSVRRLIERGRFPFEGQTVSQLMHMPVIGAFLRPEYELPRSSNLAVALEIAGDVIALKLAGDEWNMNFNARITGGVGYVF